MNLFKKHSPRERFPVLWLILATYLLLLAARIVDASLLDRGNEYIGVVLLELLIFVLPPAFYIVLRRRTAGRAREASPPASKGLPANKTGASVYRPSRLYSLRGLRIRIPRSSHILLILSAALALVTGGLLLAIAFGGIDRLGGSFSLYDTFISKNDKTAAGSIYLIFAFALLPAICEEFLFRALLCAELEEGGVLRALIFSSLFFGLLHFNLALLPLYVYSGLVLALTMYLSRSALSSAAAHFLYNLFGIFTRRYVATFYKTTGSLGLFMVILIAAFLLSAALFCFSAGRLCRRYSERNQKPRYLTGMSASETGRALLAVASSPPAVACMAVFIVTIIVFK